MSGNSYGVKRAQARFSSAGAATEMTEGFYFYQWMKDFAANFEETYDSFVQICEKVQKENFDADHLTVSVTSQREQDDISKIVQAFSGNEHADVCESTTLAYRNLAQKEAIQIPAGISYAVSAGNLKRLEQEYNCEMEVLATILSFDYLWNEVRVKGGASGCGFSIGTTGEINFTSYRDPDPANSIEVYNNTSKYIRAFCNDEEPLDKYIISTAAFQEPLKQTRILAEYADADYFRGITYEDRVGMRSHILQMKKSDLLKYAELMDKISEEKTYCVIGNEQAIAQCCDESWQIESI